MRPAPLRNAADSWMRFPSSRTTDLASASNAYFGIMWSQVSNGLANGFLKRSSIDPTVALRFQF